MPNITHDFATVAGTSIAFDAASDVLSFGAAYAAARVSLVQSGANLILSIDGKSVTLTGMTLEKLRTAALSFADGGTVQVGDALATTSADHGKNLLTGADRADYLSGLGGDDVLTGGKGNDMILTGGGTDTVVAGDGDDIIVMGADLGAADRIDGGAGSDTLRLAGNYNVTLVDGTVRDVERIVLEGDDVATASRSYRIVTHDGTVADGALLTVDASGLDALDTLAFDGSDEQSGRFAVTGGAGSDTITGGMGADTINGGAGNDVIDGGQGADVLTGGAGSDVFVVRRGTARSDSSPTTADRITDFEGAGVIGGDLIRLPVPSGGKALAFAGYRPFVLGSGAVQAPNPGDGFADVFYDHLNGQTRIAVDVNDDGIISEVDQIIILDGIYSIQPEDFDAAFSVVRGTEGADNILGSASGETIFGLGGNDVIQGLGGNDTIHGGAGEDTLYGGIGTDTLNGDAEADTLYGGEGGDTLNGGEGDDILHGEADGDTLNGGAGKDKLYGGTGADSLNGNDGDDLLWGGDDADNLYGGNDNDTLHGEKGRDDLRGDAGNDMLHGGEDNDTLRGGAGTDTLYGGTGNDTIMGGTDTDSNDGVVDYLYGEDGDDTLYAGSGRDVLSGGAGADRFVVTNETSSAAGPNRITDFDPTQDKIQLGINTTKPLAWYGYKPFFFDGTFGNGGVQFPLAGDGLADAIWDYDAATNTTRIAVDVNDDGVFSTGDLLIYLDGQHELSSSMFVDTFSVIRGGAGSDVMPGTEGIDTYYGMGGDDVITGAGGADTLYGGDDNDTIDGGQGQDKIYGDAGNDVLTGGDGAFRDELYGGVGDDKLDGGEGDDVLYGQADKDELRGGAGDDSLDGGAGDDKAWGGIGVDALRGGDDNDQLWGEAGKDTLYGDAGNDLLDGGAENDTLYGGAGNDGLIGGEGADSLDGGSGIDTLDGGAGDDFIRFTENDSVTGGTGADFFWTFYNSDASTLSNHARITDFQQGIDRIGINGINGNNKTFVFNPGSRNLGVLSTSGPNQTILGNAGDGLHDIYYSITPDGLTTWMVVDLNDDGKLDADDLVVRFDGSVEFTAADFEAGLFKVVRGSEGADVLNGTAEVDTIYGVGGNDIINGLGGKDVLFGGAGDDTIDGGAEYDIVYGGADNDILRGGEGDFRDDLYGEAGNDSLYGEAGDDQLSGGAGADKVYGGIGHDTLYGGDGNDIVQGDDGDDYIDGGAQDDTIAGGAGKDRLYGSEGNDSIDGGDQDDTVYGGGGNDALVGGEGNDLLVGEAGADTVDGGGGDDSIRFSDNDVVTGGSGNDIFWTFYNANESALASMARITDFTQGSDQLAFTGINGNGKNYVFNAGNRALGTLSTSGPTQTILGNGGDGLHDILYSFSADGLSTYLILDVNDDGKLDASDIVVRFDGQIHFNTADFQAGLLQILRGSEGDDFIEGSTGNDTIYGLGGKDTINGGEGRDIISGAGGDDIIDGGLGQDEIYGGEGNDTLKGGAGDFRDDLRGEAGDDVVDGGDGDDYLQGGSGKDTITGGLGADTIYGGDGGDVIDGGEGDDYVDGGADKDVITGGLGNDRLVGEDGDDTLIGGDGNDTLNGGNGADIIIGGEGNDSIDGGAGADAMNGGIGNDSLRFGAGDKATGGAGADTFWTWYNSSDLSVLGNMGRIVDFEQGVDKLSIAGLNGNGKRYAVNPVALPSGVKVGDALPFAGDAFHDIAFSHETGPDGPFTRVYVDLDDDGKLDADDLVFDIAGHVSLTANDFHADIFLSERGTPGDDVLQGGTAADSIWGVDGNDTIRGGGANDSLYGQNGADSLYGEQGSDYLYGGEGGDTLYGGIDGDQLHGEGGNDILEGQEGDDSLYGGAGPDIVRGGFGADNLNGGDDNDTLEGGADNDTLNGDDGDDILLGQDGADTLKGGLGNDSIQGGALSDTITGGKGNDTIDGGTEIDTAIFEGKISEYEIVAENGGITVRDRVANRDGVDFLTNVEKLQFSDGTAQGAFLTVSDAVIVEGDNGQKMMAFTVSLIGTSAGGVSVAYQTVNGTATAGSDYGARSGTLTFGAGETAKIIYVPINGDAANEVDETLSLTLNNPSGATILDGVGVGTILNDDVTASISDAQIAEGNAGTRTLTFTITLDKAAVGPVSVSYQTVDGSAAAGSDYNAASGIVQFAAGDTSKTISITVRGDMAAEMDENFILKLLTATGGRIGDGEGTGTILNDDQNQAPVAVADAFTVDHNKALETTAAALLANDSDPNGDPLKLVSVQGGVNGTVSIVDGKIVFTPATGYSGPASFTYTISDGTGGTATATAHVTVKAPLPPPNEAPVAQADSYGLAEDAVLSVPANSGVLANDSDANPQDVLTALLVTGPQHGTLTLNPDGSFVYRPHDNYNGPDSFTYKANDGKVDSAPVTVTLNVTPVNDAPKGTADSYTIDEDGMLVVTAANGVLKNDSDPDGNAVSAQLVSGPANGTLTLNADGSFSYVPKANYSGTDSFTYRPTDGTSPGQPVTVTLRVNGVNDAPDAVNDGPFTTAQGTPFQKTVAQLLANDKDVDGDALSVLSVQDAVGGTVSLVNGVVTFTPTAGYSGAASYSYTIGDGKGGTDTATVSITVSGPANTPPAGAADSYSMAEDGTLAVSAANGVLKNDSDANGDPITAQLVSGPSHGTLTLNADGSFVYKPTGHYNGADSFTYRPTDGKTPGQPVTVTIGVTPVNDAPDAVNDGPFATGYQTALSLNAAQLLANDSDRDGDALSILSVGNAVGGTVSLVDGVITFVPATGFSGAASYSYTVSDGQGGSDTATVSITVGARPNGGNDKFVSTAANETFDGGAGTDEVSYAGLNAGVTVSLAKTGAQNTGAGGVDTLIGIENLIGTAYADRLTGDANANLLKGGAGADMLDGGAGADRMEGGEGDDSYYVDDAGDVVVELANGGVDTVNAAIGYTLTGNIENLVLTGSANIDGTGANNDNRMTGNSGNNILNGLSGMDLLYGGGGNDRLHGGAQDDRLYGEAGHDYLDGGTNVDFLDGGDGNDILDGGTNADRMEGGNGDDAYYVDHSGDMVVEQSGALSGLDIVYSTISYTLTASVERLSLTGTANLTATGNAGDNRMSGNSGDNILSGLDGADELYAGAGHDSLYGGAGSDKLYGAAGNDLLDGGAGADRMEGGSGHDSYYVDDAGDLVVETDASTLGGSDIVYATVSYGLSANVERLSLMGTGHIDGTGNAGDNRIGGNGGSNALYGLGGADQLYGGGGNDVLDGGAGADMLFGGTGSDRFVFASASDAQGDRIMDFASGDRIDLSGIDASTTAAGNNAFSYIGAAAFSGVAGQLRATMGDGGLQVSGDVNGDGMADFTFAVAGVETLAAYDFLL
ncbi:MAG: Ig-like domain-containing protein [Sphingobium sp.]